MEFTRMHVAKFFVGFCAELTNGCLEKQVSVEPQ